MDLFALAAEKWEKIPKQTPENEPPKPPAERLKSRSHSAPLTAEAAPSQKLPSAVYALKQVF